MFSTNFLLLTPELIERRSNCFTIIVYINGLKPQTLYLFDPTCYSDFPVIFYPIPSMGMVYLPT